MSADSSTLRFSARRTALGGATLLFKIDADSHSALSHSLNKDVKLDNSDGIVLSLASMTTLQTVYPSTRYTKNDLQGTYAKESEVSPKIRPMKRSACGIRDWS